MLSQLFESLIYLVLCVWNVKEFPTSRYSRFQNDIADLALWLWYAQNQLYYTHQQSDQTKGTLNTLGTVNFIYRAIIPLLLCHFPHSEQGIINKKEEEGLSVNYDFTVSWLLKSENYLNLALYLFWKFSSRQAHFWQCFLWITWRHDQRLGFWTLDPRVSPRVSRNSITCATMHIWDTLFIYLLID